MLLIGWLESLIGPGKVAISNLPPICNPNFSFMGEFEKKFK